MLAYNYVAASAAQRNEVVAKQQRIARFLDQQGLDALVISTQKNFAWATGGANNWVSIAEEKGVTSLIYRADGRMLAVTENIELPRMTEEEKLSELGFELMALPWWEEGQRPKVLLDLAGSKRVGTDLHLPGAEHVDDALTQLRWSLLPEERERYRQVCQAAAEALETTCQEIVPGMSEWEIAGYLTQASYARNLVPFVTLVAADERAYRYRHPIPTTKKVEQYVMVVLCAKAGGLIANCTRLVHFGPVSPELLQKHRELQTIDATFNLASRPGVTAGEVFVAAQKAYAYAGYPDEWQLHHQGGATGYTSRDYRANPTSTEVVEEWQAFAWNPSIAGTKSEDTVLVSSDPASPVEVLTRPANSTWPLATVTIEGFGSIDRPEILEK